MNNMNQKEVTTNKETLELTPKKNMSIVINYTIYKSKNRQISRGQYVPLLCTKSKWQLC